MRRLPQQYHNPHVRRERDPRALRRQVWLLAGCLVLAAGFVAAVRYQSGAVEHGYRTEALRRERERLLDEQRRLRFELEQSSSPAQLEAAARELGMRPTRASQLETPAPRAPEERQPHAFVGAAAAGAVMRR